MVSRLGGKRKCDSLISDWLVLTLHFLKLSSLDRNPGTSLTIFFLCLFAQFLTVHSHHFSYLYHLFRTTNSNNNLLQQVTSFPTSCSVTLEENISTTQTELFHDNRREALPKKLEELVAGPSTSTSEWPSLLASQRTIETSVPASSIPPGQKPPASPAMPVSWAIKKKSPQDYERDRVEKYAQYFQGDEILPVPKLVEVEPKTVLYHHWPKD